MELKAGVSLSTFIFIPELRLTSYKDFFMEHSIPYFVKKLGEKPYLVLPSLLLLSFWVCFRLIQFILIADGGDIFFQIDQVVEAWVMGFFIGIVGVILIWRLSVADTILRHMVFEKYRKAKQLIDSDAQKNIRQLADRLKGNPNLIKKLLRLVALAPEAFVTLTLSLAAANILLYVVAYFKIHEFIYCNFPWAVAAFIGLHLLYNDIWVVESLKKTIGNIPITEFADLLKLMEKFMNQLTDTELKVLRLHYVNGKSIRETAKDMDIEESTVRTHVNNINRKWDPYDAEVSGIVTMKERLAKFFRLHNLSLI
ncbi:MAG: LuxR C-terminal-related transcriptional regulator [Thermoanaerobaculia bacterium]|nr:LuxR C-terminal-related transcriptional regulator [Thermoanaerobaculia bacterium]